MTYNQLQDLAEKLEAHLRENKLFASAWATPLYIEVEINWGDWKHEHLRCKWLTDEFLEKLGMTAHIATEVTEEDGSDCYSAIHRIYVK